MKSRFRPVLFLACLIVPNLTGAVAGLLIAPKTKPVYESLILPPGAPPAVVFPIVWTILYLIMGYASYLIAASGDDKRQTALGLYGIMLGLLFAWPLIFFLGEQFGLALAVILVLDIVAGCTIFAFAKISRPAALLIALCSIWYLFATYLNAGVWYLNG